MSYIQTKLWIVDKNNQDLRYMNEIKEAALWIKSGDIVAFPTETVYGLGANALEDHAVAKIFEAKGRPSDNPLIVHIAKREQVEQLVTMIPPMAHQLMDAFWPGPLTLVLPSKGKVSTLVSAGLSTIAIRMPDHPVALALIENAEVPIAAPSANRSGKPSPTQAIHVVHDLVGKIHGVLDGGPTGVGLESTVVDCTTDSPIILRPGGITKQQIENVVGKVIFDPALKDEREAPRSPGVKYTHYAPNAPLILVEEFERINQLIQEEKFEGRRVGVLTTAENIKSYEHADIVLSCGERNNLKTVAQNLYDVLRKFDEHKVDIIYSETFPSEGVGQAIMNRLKKASSKL